MSDLSDLGNLDPLAGFSGVVDAGMLARLIGCTPAELPTACLDKLAAHDLRFRPLDQAGRDAHILKILGRLEDDGLRRSTGSNLETFEAGWRENHALCLAHGVTRANLKPKYVRPYRCIRLDGDYVAPADPFILDHLLWMSVNWSFWRYFQDPRIDTVCEFGCGTGQYLYDLAQAFPDKQLIGTDWTEASGQILGLMAQAGMRVRGARFDMMQPDWGFALPRGAAVLTVGALEQIGPHHDAFLAYLLAQQPALVVHHEPIEDFYDRGTLPDHLGLAFHRKRQYLSGYLPALRRLHEQGTIELIEACRVPFGDPFHESASRIVWRPRG